MSASMLQELLNAIDPDKTSNNNKEKDRRRLNSNRVNYSDLANDKFQKKTLKSYKKADCTTNIVSNRTKKLTIDEARNVHKLQQKAKKENLKKLELIKDTCTLKLNKQLTRQLFDRAISKRPVLIKNRKKNASKKTAFTEEDFANFEAEYFDE